MMPLSMLVCLVIGAVLQALAPAWGRFGMAKPPILLGLVMYYALTRDRGWVIVAALAAGILQDGLGRIPLGYSAGCFCLVALTVQRFRDTVFVFRAITHFVLGAAGAVVVTLMLALLLAQEGLIEPMPGWVLSKVAGAAVLGAIVVPVVFRVAEGLDLRLGLAGEEAL